MSYVYLLSCHEEHGSINVTATLDRDYLETLARENWPDAGEWVEASLVGLRELLAKSDTELADGNGHNCNFGWGGMQLHVVEIK